MGQLSVSRFSLASHRSLLRFSPICRTSRTSTCSSNKVTSAQVSPSSALQPADCTLPPPCPCNDVYWILPGYGLIRGMIARTVVSIFMHSRRGERATCASLDRHHSFARSSALGLQDGFPGVPSLKHLAQSGILSGRQMWAQGSWPGAGPGHPGDTVFSALLEYCRLLCFNAAHSPQIVHHHSRYEGRLDCSCPWGRP